MHVSIPAKTLRLILLGTVMLAVLVAIATAAIVARAFNAGAHRAAAEEGVEVRMEKDANVSEAGIQTANNLWLRSSGCLIPSEGNGCLEIDQWLLNAHGPSGVGSWEEGVAFDSSKVSVTPVPDTTWLQSLGRTATCSVSVPNEDSRLVGCTTDGLSPGPAGDGLLQRLYIVPNTYDLTNGGQIRPSRGNGITTGIADENCRALGTLSDQMPGTLPGGYISTCSDAQVKVRILEGDLDLDCDVDVVDRQAVAFRFGYAVGEPGYNEWYDVASDAPDGEIDILDVQFVFGRGFSTCLAPIPEYQAQVDQPPPQPTAPPDAGVETEVISDGLEPGTEVVVVVRAYNVPSAGVGAVETTWAFDPEVIEGGSIAPDPTALESTGRIANCTFRLRFAGVVRQGCVTTDNPSIPGIQPAPSGTVELPFHFRRLSTGPTSINLVEAVVGDPLGNELYTAAPTPTATATPTSAPTRTPTPTATRRPGVGGAVKLPPAAVDAESNAHSESSGWSVGAYAALALGLGAAFAALGIGTWYARRRRPY